MTASLHIVAVRWPEITTDDDLVRLLIRTVRLRTGQVLVITSKVVSKATGRVMSGQRLEWIASETQRVVARRGETIIAQTHTGLVLAAAGVDASNLPAGTVALLPEDADAAARWLRTRIAESTGCNVAVLISDTAGRAWRVGQTDLAIGCAGVPPLLDLRGSVDAFGRVLDVTVPAVADEIAAAADLTKGKLTGCPVAVVEGLENLVLPPGEFGPGAAALVRAAEADLFGLGARDAVVAAALRDDDEALRHFPRLGDDEDVPFEALVVPSARRDVVIHVTRSGVADERSWLVRIEVRVGAGVDAYLAAGRLVERTRVLAAGYQLVRKRTPDQARPSPGWRAVDSTMWRTP